MKILTIDDLLLLSCWGFLLGLVESGVFLIHSIYYIKYLNLQQSHPFVTITNTEGAIAIFLVYYSAMILFLFIDERNGV